MDSEQALQLRVDLPGGGAEARTPMFRESGVTNSKVAGKRRYKLRGHGKVEIQTPTFQKSGVAMGVMHLQMYAIGQHTLIKIWEDTSAEI
ncbi:hypothetical protein PAXRUDRAFT_21611 [Paxillus rubicundulus Ve08.2h10]|uniref:Uncharacterized protein n=1 Tax=Paxillus rubicundulus Ve08.2h10 TaxID=930991 RepID=A0A0D0CB52_9AGAM|nr:hypothetical protein PAXRUDRAFT_21611 [Paxillus rubicundulus Ve08.2h10]